MNLQIDNQLFIVVGATSGLGGAVTQRLIAEGAIVIAVARRIVQLEALQQQYKKQIEIVVGDITLPTTMDKIIEQIGNRYLAGVLLNTGAAAAGPLMKTTLAQWDQAYHAVLRWKVDLSKRLAKKFIQQNYGRLVYVESVSLKHPVPNLGMSNSLRKAVEGFIYTFAEEMAEYGITANILGPGYHDTALMERSFARKGEQEGRSSLEVKKEFIKTNMKSGQMGNPTDFAQLAIWLLSPSSRFVTGQTIIVDGAYHD